MKIQGKRLIAGWLGFFVVVGFAVWVLAGQITKNRFAIGLYPAGDTPDLRPARRIGFVLQQAGTVVPDDQELVVRIEKKRAGRGGLQAVAYLLSPKGDRLFARQFMQVAQDRAGRLIEQATFPPLQSVANVPAGDKVALVVVRFPSGQDAADGLFAVEQAGDRAAPVQMDRIVQMRLAAEARGWFVEQVQVPVQKNSSK